MDIFCSVRAGLDGQYMVRREQEGPLEFFVDGGGIEQFTLTDLREKMKQAIKDIATLQCQANEPIRARLVCERCGELHVDEGEFATKVHHTHACQHCGAVWRPMVQNSVGVTFLPGFKNEEPPK
jgi:hypothetical protein